MNLTRQISSLLACMLLLASGCGESITSPLVGSWDVVELDSVLEQVNQDSLETEEDQESMKDSPPRMSIIFKPDGVLQTETELGQLNVNKAGTWKLIPSNESASLLKIECVLADQHTEHEVQFIDDNTIQLIPPNMAGVSMKLKFKRR